MRVLICGDHPSGPGGIAGVMRTLERQLRGSSADATDVKYVFLDPRGRRSWAARTSGAALVRIALHLIRGADIVHLNTASYGSTFRNLAVSVMARVLGVPYVVHLHGGAYEQFMAGSRPAVQRLVRWYFSGANQVVTLTRSWYDFASTVLCVPVERLHTIPNGTDAPRPEWLYTAEFSPPTFLFVGRLTDKKGLPVLLRAFAGVTKLTDARLFLVGEEADDETAAMLARRPPNVEVLGWLHHDRTLELMAQARALVLPSRMENMPLTVLEAMSVGTAVIASRVGGLPDTVDHGVDGLLVEVGNVDELRQALLTLCKDSHQAMTLGDRGREKWLREYDSAKMADRLIETWRRTHA